MGSWGEICFSKQFLEPLSIQPTKGNELATYFPHCFWLMATTFYVALPRLAAVNKKAALKLKRSVHLWEETLNKMMDIRADLLWEHIILVDIKVIFI